MTSSPFGWLFSAVLAAAFAVSGCQQQQGGSLASVMDSATLVSTAQAAPAAAPAVPSAPRSGIWHERGPNDPLPAGFSPMQSLAPLVKTLKPGVVNIYTTASVRPRGRSRVPPGFDDPFEEFFRRFQEGAPEEQRRQSLGSGFLVGDDGLVLTNNHVVEGASQIKVKLDDGREFDAQAVGRDPKTDVALLRLRGDGAALKGLPVAFLGNSDALEVGDFVIAVGNPFGLDHSVSLGIVSAKERVIGAGPYDDFIQTDAAINPGNSGGPLFNNRGEVIGVNTAIVAHGQGIGFAVPINMVKELLPSLLDKGRVVRGWLGVSIQDVTPELASTLGLDRARGALVSQVYRNSPADHAGLKAGDVVVAVNGRKVDTFNQLSRFVAFLAPGARAQLQVVREGKERTIDTKVGERPEDEQMVASGQVAPGEAEPASDKLGLAVQPVNQQLLQRLGVDSGVQIVAVAPNGPAARAGARLGDVVVELQRRPVRNVREYSAAAAALKPGEMALLRLQRENASIYVAVQIPRR